MKKRLKKEEELTELFGEKSEIIFNEFISFFPEFAEAEDEAEEPGFLRKLLCCLKTTQEPPAATEDLGIVGPGGPLVDDESSIPPHKAFFCLGPTNCIRAGAFKFINWPVFENVVLFCIILSSLLLAADPPDASDRQAHPHACARAHMRTHTHVCSFGLRSPTGSFC